MASHGSDTPTSPRAILDHTETILCTFMHTTVVICLHSDTNNLFKEFKIFLKNHVLVIKMGPFHIFVVYIDRN